MVEAVDLCQHCGNLTVQVVRVSQEKDHERGRSEWMEKMTVIDVKHPAPTEMPFRLGLDVPTDNETVCGMARCLEEGQ